MVALLLLALAQTPPPATAKPPAAPAQATPPPQTTAPKPQPKATAAATTTALLFITDGAGAAIEGVTVSVTGPVDREAKSPDSGPTRIPGLRAGTYRVRFAREGYITFEKELVWRAGTAAPEMAITLNAAQPPPPPPPTTTTTTVPAEQKLPPPGAAKTMSLPDYIEKNFISNREQHKESMVGCSGVGQGIVWQVRGTWDGRIHPAADAMLYVIGGDGTLRLNGNDVSMSAGTFSVVPRGTTYALSQRGRNPLVVFAVLSGAPCAAG